MEISGYLLVDVCSFYIKYHREDLEKVNVWAMENEMEMNGQRKNNSVSFAKHILIYELQYSLGGEIISRGSI